MTFGSGGRRSIQLSYTRSANGGNVSVIDTGSDRVVTTIPEVGKHPWSLASFHGYNYCH